jgi:inhibitor of cysteine peptidase
MSTRRRLAMVGSILAAAIAALLLAAGCGGSGEVKLEGIDDGGRVELEKGQILVVTLESNPTTGYRWERPEGEGDRLLQQLGEAEYHARSNLLGASGTETLRFKATDNGQTELQLVYHRPWEKEAEPERTFTVQVVIQ